MQWVSEENLELLVLGSKPDYGPLGSMVSEVSSAGGVALLPWGFGKWTGSRKTVLETVLATAPEGLFLSDCANRPNGGSGGGVFGKFPAIPPLDGSDPLPVRGDERFAFSGGMAGPTFDESISDSARWVEFLKANAGTLTPVQSGTTRMESVRRQIRLRRKPLRILPEPPPVGSGASDRSDLESSSDRYARRFGGEVGRAFLDRQGSITLDLAGEALGGETAGATVLDVGGGHTQLAPLFLEKGWEVTVFGSDDSCRMRPDRILGPDSYEFVTGNLLKLPFKDDSFDVVTAFRLVPHESRWETLLEELCRVARKAVIVDYPDVRGFNALSRILFHLKKGFEKDTREYAVFNRRKIRAAFEKGGAGEVVFRPQFFLPMVFHRLTGSARILRIAEGGFEKVGLTRLFGSPVIARAMVGKKKS